MSDALHAGPPVIVTHVREQVGDRFAACGIEWVADNPNSWPTTPRLLCRACWLCGFRSKALVGDLIQIADLAEILIALGISDHARPYSAHEVVQREVLPEIRRLKEALKQ